MRILPKSALFDKDNTGTSIITTHYMVIWVPPSTAQMFLLPNGLTPCEAWEHTVSPCQFVVVKMLTLRLKPANHSFTGYKTATGYAGNASLTAPAPPDFMTHALKKRHAHDILHADLPGLTPPDTGPTGPIALAVNNLTTKIVEGQTKATSATHLSTEKTPTTYCGDGTLLLNRLTQTSTVAELPELYNVIAKSTKKNK